MPYKFPEAKLEATRRRRARNLVLIDKVRSKPCTDCGITLPPPCMDLDHVRPAADWVARTGSMLGADVSEARIKAELAKCEPRCPTCHRLRHFKENSAGRVTLF